MKDTFVKRLLKRSEFMVFCILVLIWVTLSLINKNYATVNNLCAIMKTILYGISSCRPVLVIIQGDSDISTGASAGFSAVLGTALMVETRCMGMQGAGSEWLGY